MSLVRVLIAASFATLGVAGWAAAEGCPGDCDGSGRVTVEELVRGVGIALGGTPLAECRSLDVDGDGAVAIGELVRAVGIALSSCPARPTPTAVAPSATPSPSPTIESPPTATPRMVTTLVDEGPGSLRAVLAAAQAGDTIALAVDGVIHLTRGPLLIDIASALAPSGEALALRIVGPGAAALAISADQQSRVLEVRNGVVVLQGVTIRDGRAGVGAGDPVQGGGILSSGQLQLEDCVVRDNSLVVPSGCAWDCAGAGIYSSSALTLDESWVTNNDAGDGVGGGIAARGRGKVTIRRSTLSANRADGGGGGLWFNSAIAEITNSTISGNTSAGTGGGIFVLGPMTLWYSTVANNTAAVGGGVAFACSTQQDCGVAGPSFIAASIIAANGPSACAIGRFVIAPRTGGSVDDDGTCHLNDATDRPNVDSIGLAPLAGEPPTHALSATSPALDVLPAPCGSAQAPLAIDQRGAARPAGSGCDSGAFERQSDDP